MLHSIQCQREKHGFPAIYFRLDKQVIHHDVEGMEHHISPPTLRAIEALTAQLKRRPALLAKLK